MIEKKQILSEWFVGIVRPGILVITETLIWKDYVESVNLEYELYDEIGILYLIFAILGLISTIVKFIGFIRRLKAGVLTNQNWPYKFQPGTVGFMIGILIHDIPVIFIVYFYYIKYLNILASLQLPLMIFQAAHITLMFKYWNVQRKLNWSQLKDKVFYRSNAVLGFFYIFTLLTTITCFARTVALQTGRWALLQGDPDSVPEIVLSKLAPNYMDEDMINTRSCLKTINRVNFPTPFNKSCLNDVEIAIIVLFSLVYLTGIPLLFYFLVKLSKSGYLCSYTAVTNANQTIHVEESKS